MSQEILDRKARYEAENRDKRAEAKRIKRAQAKATVYTPGTLAGVFAAEVGMHKHADGRLLNDAEWQRECELAKERGVAATRRQQEWMLEEERKMREMDPQAWAENQVFLANQQVGANHRLAKLQDTGHLMGIPDDELLTLTPFALEARILGLDTAGTYAPPEQTINGVGERCCDLCGGTAASGARFVMKEHATVIVKGETCEVTSSFNLQFQQFDGIAPRPDVCNGCLRQFVQSMLLTLDALEA